MTRTIQYLDAGGAMIFDGLAAAVWQISMTADVTNPPRVTNIIPGALYTFIFVQDAAPSTFAWPAACKNPIAVDLAPLSTTTQNFIGYSGNVLYANLPGTWT
jgi:hypothetical protein